MLQAVRRCRRLASAPGAARLVLFNIMRIHSKVSKNSVGCAQIAVYISVLSKNYLITKKDVKVTTLREVEKQTKEDQESS